MGVTKINIVEEGECPFLAQKRGFSTMQKMTNKADVELEFYKNCPEKHRPKDIYKIDGGVQYERVYGPHPTSQQDWNRVYKAGVDALWLGLDMSPQEDFIKWGLSGKWDQTHIKWTQHAHPVRILHGAPRAEHIVMADEVVFISPAKVEIVCREWDEAYLLMSIVTLWESFTRGWLVDGFRQGFVPELSPPFEVTDVHRMFLLRHWEQELQASNHSVSIYEKIHGVLEELSKDWTPGDLRERMVEIVCE